MLLPHVLREGEGRGEDHEADLALEEHRRLPDGTYEKLRNTNDYFAFIT